MKNFVSFDLTDLLKKMGVLGISYQAHTRRIYNTFIDTKKKTIIVDVYGDDIKKTIENFKKEVKGSMSNRDQEAFIKCYGDNWYKIFDEMNSNIEDTNPDQDQGFQVGAPPNTTQQTTQPPISPLTEPLSKAELVIVKAKDNIVNLFIDEYKEAHVAIKVDKHLEILPLNSGRFQNWLSRILYKEENEIIDTTTFRDAIGVLNAEAAFDSGDPITLNLRVAQVREPILECGTVNGNSKIIWYYDLTNKDHEFIEITSEGWTIIKNIDLILFRRFDNQATQVYPLGSGQYTDLKNTRDVSGEDMFNKFIDLLFNKNVKEENKENYKLLLKCYIVSLFVPDIPKPVLMPHGSQGALKSTMFEKIKDVVDPSVLKTLSFPRNKNEFIQQLAHNYVAYYDNISSILKHWISDEICRTVSGSGSSIRKLYTDDEDKIRSFKRCIGINGINLAATKPDLLDRGLQFQLQRIQKSDRLREETINKKFEELRPYVLGYILDTLVIVLHFKETQETGIEEYPRMADFAEYGEIISRCMGNEDNAFLDAYNENTQLQIDEVIESSEVAICLMYMMFTKYKDGFMQDDGSKIYEWIGTPSALLGELNSVAESSDLNINTYGRWWPKAANQLTMRINEIEPTLKEKGLIIDHLVGQGDNKERKYRIKKTASPPSPPSPESEN
jgi:hypothetical protein